MINTTFDLINIKKYWHFSNIFIFAIKPNSAVQTHIKHQSKKTHTNLRENRAHTPPKHPSPATEKPKNPRNTNHKLTTDSKKSTETTTQHTPTTTKLKQHPDAHPEDRVNSGATLRAAEAFGEGLRHGWSPIGHWSPVLGLRAEKGAPGARGRRRRGSAYAACIASRLLAPLRLGGCTGFLRLWSVLVRWWPFDFLMWDFVWLGDFDRAFSG